jgi:putative ABC transport system ATP-binding protein
MGQASDAALLVTGLTMSYGTPGNRVEVLRGVDLKIEPGEFVAVIGRSGSGKSTLLHLLAGLALPSGGSIQLGGYDLTRFGDDGRAMLRRRWIGMVFQSFQLLDMLTAEENVALPLAIAGYAHKTSQCQAAQALERVGLTHRRRHLPGALSGGEQQRVAIARALVIDPLLLLADEPTGNLDSGSAREIVSLLRALADQRRRSILMVTHDPTQAAVADRIIELQDGRIASPAVATSPAESAA